MFYVVHAHSIQPGNMIIVKSVKDLTTILAAASTRDYNGCEYTSMVMTNPADSGSNDAASSSLRTTTSGRA